MAHQVEFAVSAVRELADLKAYQRKRIHGEIKKQLIDQPTMATKNRKCLGNPPADFEFAPPLWELRIGDYRVCYDVNEEDEMVFIRAIRLKPPERRTKDILE